MNGDTILEKLIAYKSSVKKKINSGNSITINELYEGQIVEVEIIIDKIKYIQSGKSAEWEKIFKIIDNLIDLIKQANTLEQLIFSLYKGALQNNYNKIDLLWTKKEQQIETEREKSREISKKRTNNKNLKLDF